MFVRCLATRQLFWALLMLLCMGAAHAARPVPEAQRAADDWLAAFNAGSLEGLQAFAERYAKKDGSTPQDYLEFRESTGPLKLLEVRESTPLQAKLLVLAQQTERAMLVTAEMDPAHPEHLKLFQLEGTPTPETVPARTRSLAGADG